MYNTLGKILKKGVLIVEELNYEMIEPCLVSFIHQEVTKTSLQKVVIGLSGGIDSAVVAVLAKKAFGDKLLAVLIPSHYSSANSLDDALALCQKFDIKYEIKSIENQLKSFENKTILSQLRLGNISARLRMITLYDISARDGSLVLGTSNKSELLLGYGTIFGDLASAINPIGDLYKSEVFAFAKYLGVNESIISKPPSADLYSGQSDESDLGYSYAQIDEVLNDFVQNRVQEHNLLKRYDNKLVKMIIQKFYQNHFKRKMPIIAKLRDRTVGFDLLYARDVKL